MSIIRIAKDPNDIRAARANRARHGFWVENPAAVAYLQINTDGVVINVGHPAFAHFLNCHWKEVKVYCDHMKGWGMEHIHD